MHYIHLLGACIDMVYGIGVFHGYGLYDASCGVCDGIFVLLYLVFAKGIPKRGGEERGRLGIWALFTRIFIFSTRRSWIAVIPGTLEELANCEFFWRCVSTEGM